MTDESMIVSDDEADRSLESLVTGPVVPVSGWEQLPETGPTTKAATGDPSKAAAASEAERRLLRAIVEHPLRPSSAYPSLARISPNTFQKLRPALVGRGLVRERKLESGGRRGRSTLRLEPLDAARELLSAGGEEWIVTEVSNDAR
jgi:hypothetical protein